MNDDEWHGAASDEIVVTVGAGESVQWDADTIFSSEIWNSPLLWPRDDHFGPALHVFVGRAIERLAAFAPQGREGKEALFWAGKLLIDSAAAGNVGTCLDTSAGKSWFARTGRPALDRHRDASALANCGFRGQDGSRTSLFVNAEDLSWLLGETAARRQQPCAAVAPERSQAGPKGPGRPPDALCRAKTWIQSHYPSGLPSGVSLKSAARDADVSADTMRRALRSDK